MSDVRRSRDIGPVRQLLVRKRTATGRVAALAAPAGWLATGSLPRDADPWFVDEGDLDAARELVASAAKATLFLYPGSGHLFADSSRPDYDAAAAALLTQRVLDFLATV